MNEHTDKPFTRHDASDTDIERRQLLKMTGTGAAAMGLAMAVPGQASAQTRVKLGDKWDKTFPRSDKLITGKSASGTVMASPWQRTYTCPRTPAASWRRSWSAAFGAVKEQSSGLYAQTMAEHGLITLPFDPSYTGESGANRATWLRPTSTLKTTARLLTSSACCRTSTASASAPSVFAA
ncbi:twin-arginine translocation signal domain-containing protein [Massilia agri]|uniref:Twin-arginine translocation signal domain-containing protein n=1 Tax=Massilia agri TaxID=1886785 RepID=A0ABT2ANJ6_9BURK|nr:twin-arginine translocation signal domain-containing protein [Massilia agri]MCS0597793.1 twin-arginine translocation signal domain-containing protein [Massilia agri]